MFEEFGPENPPQPPSGALEQAMTRGRTIRRQRRAGIVSGVVLSVALIGGFALTNPLHSNKAFVPPAIQPTSTPADYSPIASPVGSEQKTLDGGKLTSITTAPNGVISVHVNREKLYTGKAAAAAAESNGEPPLDDFYQEDLDGDQLLTFTLDPEASIQVTAALSSNGEQVADFPTPENVAPAVLISRFKKLNLPAVPDPDTDFRPVVWLRHTNGPDGPVTAILEQFVP